MQVTDHEARKTISYNLRRLQGETPYAHIAREAGTSTGAIRDIALEKRTPGIGLLIRLANAFQVDIKEFLKSPPKSRKSS